MVSKMIYSSEGVMQTMDFDKKYIVKVLEFIGHREAGGVTEVRIIPKSRYIFINKRKVYVGRIISGYYVNYEKLARDIEPYDGKANIYVTLNPCKPELLSRLTDMLRVNPKVTTGDDDILCDMWFPIDIDPVRPADTSSTDDELGLALSKRDEVADYLSKWTIAVKGMSGNGCHGLIRLTGYPNNQETRQAKELLTRFLSERFSDWKKDSKGRFILDERGRKILNTHGVSIDNTVSNMSRLWKLYGTIACKGNNTPDRPHRRSYLAMQDVTPVDLYSKIEEIIPRDYIKKAKSQNSLSYRNSITIPNGKSPNGFRVLDVPAYLSAWGGEWRIKKKGTVTWYQFKICPLHQDHDGDKWECGICQFPDGKMGAKCMHEPSYNWQDFKSVLGDPREFCQSSIYSINTIKR
jgi:hypothetical protein